MPCTAKSELQELKKQIYRLHKEYLDNGDGHNGFIHDLSVLVSDGLEDGYSARQMAENGKKVFLFDGDMGLANAQIALGVKARENISHVILGEKNINEIVIQVSPGFSLIPGASGVQQMAALNNIEMAGIVSIFSEIKAEIDFFII